MVTVEYIEMMHDSKTTPSLKSGQLQKSVEKYMNDSTSSYSSKKSFVTFASQFYIAPALLQRILDSVVNSYFDRAHELLFLVKFCSKQCFKMKRTF